MTAHARCKVEGCEDKRFGHGYCNKHYKRWRKYGDPEVVAFERQPGRLCSVPDCVRPHKARGLCFAHWTRWKSSGVVPTTPVIPKPRGQNIGPCLRPGCDGDSRGSGYCPKHYSRMRLFMKYGLNGWDDYDVMWEAAGGKCQVCGSALTFDGKDSHIDHDHATGKPRGLLCRGCNHGLGHFQDDIDRLQAAIAYLSRR